MLKRLFGVIIGALLLAPIAGAQSGLPTLHSDGPPFDRNTRYMYESGTDLYICQSKAYAPSTVLTQTAISNAAAAVFTVTNHGLHLSSNPNVTVTGGTGGWAAINGTHRATVIDANTFSVPVNSSTLGAVTGTVVVTTNAPRTSQAIWTVLKVVSNASNKAIASMWAAGGDTLVCDNRTSLSYQ